MKHNKSLYEKYEMKQGDSESNVIEEQTYETVVFVRPDLVDKIRSNFTCSFVNWILIRFWPKKEENELDDLEMQVVRYKPEGLEALCKNTKFSKKELQIMYRGFKQECPTGIVNEDTFKDIYAQFFPQGDSSQYAHFVFNSFDQDHSGTISFEEFVSGLSILARGSLHEKLKWAFTLYDINNDGMITKEEMVDIVNAIYGMMGKHTEPSMDEYTARDHVDLVFQKFDMNKDGVISMEEFMECCRMDEFVIKNICIFDTVL